MPYRRTALAFAALAPVAAASVLLGGTSAAARVPHSTTPVPLSFNHLVLDTPATPDAEIVSPSTQPLTAVAQVDTSTGQFTINPSDFHAPTYNFTSPVPGSATITLKNPATGQLNPADGSVSLNGDFLTTITLNGQGSCTKDSGPLTVTTATSQPLPGFKFPAGTTGVATGKGALGAGWSSLAPGTGSACPLVDGATNGKGGIWISRDISPQEAKAAAAPKVVVTGPAAVSAKVGKVVRYAATVTNSGADDTASVTVCLTVPARLKASACQTVTTPKSKSTKKLIFTVTTKGAKPGTYKLVLTATGAKSQTVKLKLRK